MIPALFLSCAGQKKNEESQITQPEEIAQAQRLVQTHARHQAAGSGVFELDGKMVDMPIVRMAECVLEKAQAAGLLD